MILKRVLSRISLGLDRLSGDEGSCKNQGAFKNQLGLDRLSGDSLKGAFKNQIGSGSTFG